MRVYRFYSWLLNADLPAPLCFSLAVTRSKDVPPFGPPLPDDSLFSPSPEFAEFLLTKGTCRKMNLSNLR